MRLPSDYKLPPNTRELGAPGQTQERAWPQGPSCWAREPLGEDESTGLGPARSRVWRESSVSSVGERAREKARKPECTNGQRRLQ